MDSMKYGTCSPYISDESLNRIIAICIDKNVSKYDGEIYVGDYIRTTSNGIKKYLGDRNVDIKYF